jgi:hypothetical protein
MPEEVKSAELKGAEPTATPEKKAVSKEAPPPLFSQEELRKSFSAEDIRRIRIEKAIERRRANSYLEANGDRPGGGNIYIENLYGGVATGDKGAVNNFSADESTGKSRLIVCVYRSELAQVRRHYVPPPHYDRALQMLREQHLIILYGAAGLGKFTTALHLVSALHEKAVFEMEPSLNFDRLDLNALGKGRGHVIDTLGQESANGLRPAQVARVARELRKAGHHLVITVDGRTSLPLAGLNEFVVRWNEPPEAETLLRRHLQALDEDKVAAVARKDAVQELLRSHPLPGDVVTLAALLRDVVAGSLALEEVANRFQGRVEQHVAQWFEEHTALEERTLLLAVAVFNGANYQDVADADQALQAKLRGPGEAPADGSVSPLLGKSRRERLESVSAEVEAAFEETEFGRSPVEIVKLKQDACQPVVLRFLWREYDRARGPLLEWLRDCARHSKVDVRAAAAAAVGELSRSDFTFLVESVIRPWANHDEARQRIAAALALGIPAWSGELAPQVLSLLHHWSTLDTLENWKLAWTAAAAYGDLTGLRFPDLALQDLRRIAETRDVRLLHAALRSLQRLFEEGRVNFEFHLKVIRALHQWAGEADTEDGQLIPLWFFLKLAHDSRMDWPESGASRPTVAWLAWSGQPSRSLVVELLALSLNHNGIYTWALEILRRWVEEAGADASQASELENLARQLAGRTPRDRERLEFYLERWAEGPNGGAGLAAKLRAVIDDLAVTT